MCSFRQPSVCVSQAKGASTGSLWVCLLREPSVAAMTVCVCVCVCVCVRAHVHAFVVVCVCISLLTIREMDKLEKWNN